MAEKREITYVNIFLASSIDELREDRIAIGDYVRKLNDIYMERGVYFRLFMCEDESLAMANQRKQEEYNEDIRASQLFFIILFNRAGEYTLEEFDVALEQFRAAGNPAIVTCFRQGEGYAPERSVLDFMERLDKGLGHYFKVYEHIDSLKLSLLMQVKLMDLDVPVEFRDGRAYAGGQEVLTLENLPAFVKNVDFQKLRAEYEASEAEFQAAKARYLADPTGDDGFIAAGERRAKAQKALRELEENLFRLLLNAEERGSKNELTPRQREAYRLLEQGKSREASAMLDMEEILSDAAHEEALGQQVKERLERRVDELLQKIEIEETLVDDPTRFERIEQIYEVRSPWRRGRICASAQCGSIAVTCSNNTHMTARWNGACATRNTWSWSGQRITLQMLATFWAACIATPAVWSKRRRNTCAPKRSAKSSRRKIRKYTYRTSLVPAAILATCTATPIAWSKRRPNICVPRRFVKSLRRKIRLHISQTSPGSATISASCTTIRSAWSKRRRHTCAPRRFMKSSRRKTRWHTFRTSPTPATTSASIQRHEPQGRSGGGIPACREDT